MRPEPHDPGVACAGILLICACVLMAQCIDNVPKKRKAQEITKDILIDEHKVAEQSFDTIDFAVYSVDNKNAERDSARIAKKLRSFVRDNIDKREYQSWYRPAVGPQNTRILGFDTDKAKQNKDVQKMLADYRKVVIVLEAQRRAGKIK